MYFIDRADAGRRLAGALLTYRYESCVVLGLSDGGVLVGEQIAATLHCPLTMLLTEEIAIPGEETIVGTVDQEGHFVQSSSFSDSVYQDYYSEFHGYIEDQKRQKYSHINHLLGDGGIVDRAMLRGNVVIAVADGLPTGASLDAVAEFLKPIKVARLVVAAPVASVQAVDRMHMLGDELHVLNVAQNFLETNHYYDDNTLPSHEEVINHINQMILNWR